MKLTILAMALLTIAASSCAIRSNTVSLVNASALTEGEKHRLYSAALAASDSPLESEIFKSVCLRIGIFDAGGAPNDSYVSFVSAHVDWAMKAENEPFKAQINSKEKAREYISQHLPRLSEWRPK